MNPAAKRALSLTLGALATTAALSWAAMEFLPSTVFFPVVEYDFPGDIHFAMFRHAELDRASCERAAGEMSTSVAKSCPQCRTSTTCFRGLDESRRRILSREPLATPSARNSGMTMTISARNGDLALEVCRLLERQPASQPSGSRLRCYPAQSQR